MPRSRMRRGATDSEEKGGQATLLRALRRDREQEENGVRNSFSYLMLLFSGGETLKNFQARFPGTMRVEKQLLYWNKGQRDRSTEAHQTTG